MNQYESNRQPNGYFYYVYKTTCVITGRFYVGQHRTTDLDDGYLGSGVRLLKSVKKHGHDAHHREILEFCKDDESLNLCEAKFVNIDVMNHPLCLNLKTGGDLFKHSEDTRSRIAKKNRDRMKDPIMLDKIRKSKIGVPMSESAKQKMKDAALSRPRQKHTEETKKKIKQALIGKKRTPETCALISQRNREMKMKPEIREKQRQSALKLLENQDFVKRRRQASIEGMEKKRGQKRKPRPESFDILSARAKLAMTPELREYLSLKAKEQHANNKLLLSCLQYILNHTSINLQVFLQQEI